jgi:phosphonopyruvate decarboxylase
VLTGSRFATLLHGQGFTFAAGVPCSLIEGLISALEHDPRLPYVPAVREDVAVGLAAGAWLAGARPAVLMQNSGLGTSMNALASMALMYGIPMLLVVTWRGYQGKDAPEHILTGAITPRHLELMGIPHRVLSAASADDDVAWAASEMDRLSQPVAIVVPPGVFESGHGTRGETAGSAGVATVAEETGQTGGAGALRAARPTGELGPRTISRFAAIQAAVKQLGNEPVVHANGYPSRESHAVADRAQNFYMIGSMGLASAIGLGVASARAASPASSSTVVFDGDGNLLMNLGILPMVGARAPRRFLHLVFDNEVYGSTGNQGSPAPGVRLDLLAAAAGYRTVSAAITEDQVAAAVVAALATDGPHFILVKVTPAQADVPRIAHTPAQIRDRFRATLAL